MALPILNPKTEAFQEKSLKNQTKLNSKVTSGFDKVNSQLGKQTKLLSRVESWLDQTYELHREYYQKEDEFRREQMRALRSQRRASTAAGAAAGTAAGAGGGVGAAAAAAAVAGGAAVTAFGKKILDFFKGGKAASKLDDLAKAGSKAGSKLDDVAKAGKNAATKLDDVGKASSKTAKALTTAGDDVAKAASKAASTADDAAKVADDAVKAASKTAKTAGVAEDVADVGKVASKADDALRAAKIADAIAPPSVAARIFAKVFPPVAIVESLAVNIKDGYDVATAGLDNDIATEIQKEDIGALVGAGIGGGIGLVFGGPMGAVLGASIGNTIGEYVGNYFDTDFTDDFAEKTENMNAMRESLKTELALYDEQRQKGLMDEQAYIKEKARIEQELSILDIQETERAAVDELLNARKARAEEYNKIKAEIDRIEQAGGTASQTLLTMLAEAEQAFDKADKSFDERAKAFSDPLKAAEATGIYDDSFFNWMGFKDTIDKSRLGELTAEQLSMIAKKGDLSKADMEAVNAELKKRGLEQIQGKAKFGPGAQGQAFDDATGLLTGVSASQMAARGEPSSADYAAVADAFGGGTGVATATSTTAAVPSPGGLGGINYGSYAKAIGQRESSNKYDAVNTIGYLGKYQLGAMALEDIGLVKSGVGSKGNAALNDPKNWKNGLSKEKFLANPELQESAMAAYTKKNMGYLKHYGVITGSESKQEIAGLLAASHLKGWTGGRDMKAGKVTSDAYGTKTSEYYSIGAGTQGGGGVGPSPSGSVSGGTSGSAINATSTAQGAAGSAPTIVDNSSTVIDNSTNASSSTTNALPPTPRRSKSTGVREDMVYGM